MSCIGDCNDAYYTDVTNAWEEFKKRYNNATDDASRKEAIEWWNDQVAAIKEAWLSCLESCNEVNP